MAGLVGYASSDEEEEEEEEEIEQVSPKKASPQAAAVETVKDESDKTHQDHQKGGNQEVTPSESRAPDIDNVVIAPVQQSAVPLGPSLPPLEEPPSNEEDDTGQAPLSPYSSNRALLRDLTLPSNPNLDIPPSPPGSPPPQANKKLEQFLELKKKGVHFNAKLEQSSGLKNPSLMEKLLNFVEIDEKDQYSTTLPTDLWDPNGFPEWAFKDRLSESRARVTVDKETERAHGTRTSVDFVPSTTNTTTGNTTSSTAGGLSRGEKRKGGWK
ncbi:HCNGP-like protein-domain-containing protein [Mariannaea sp. PMI_226]|nr:HCNGP-like protein-domain-containing protein [Mariannaea sp. PMI_226]